MRQCFFFSNLLLANDLPGGPDWLVGLLLDDRLMPLYFSLLVVACTVPIVILALLQNAEAPHPAGRIRHRPTRLSASRAGAAAADQLRNTDCG
jgi:hypothetical protein